MLPLVGIDYPKKVIPLLDAARSTVDILMYDWRVYPNRPGSTVQQLNTAIARACARGVQVRAITNAALNNEAIGKLGVRVRSLRDKRVLHTKLVIVDGKKLVIGSHNFTTNAFHRNLEVSAIVDIPEDVTRFSEFFENLYII